MRAFLEQAHADTAIRRLGHLDIGAVEHGDKRRAHQIVIIYDQNSWFSPIRHTGARLPANSDPY